MMIFSTTTLDRGLFMVSLDVWRLAHGVDGGPLAK